MEVSTTPKNNALVAYTPTAQDLKTLSPSSIVDLPALIQKNGWRGLVEAGNFEADKALLSVEAVKTDFLASATHHTLQDVFKKPTATLATIKKYQGQEKMQASVFLLVSNTALMFNVGKSMSDHQITSAASVIFSEYYWMTIADLKVCFLNGVKGRYGKVFDRLDVNTFLEWLAQYAEERTSFTEGKFSEWRIREENPGVEMPQSLIDLGKRLGDRRTPFEAEVQPKYATFSAYLQSIGKDDEETHERLLDLWETECDNKELPLEGWFIYKAKQCVLLLNKGEQLPENVQAILNP